MWILQAGDYETTGKENLEKDVNSGFQVQLEVVLQDKAGWSQVVCGLQLEMGLEPNLNRTRTLVFERTEQNPNPYFTN